MSFGFRRPSISSTLDFTTPNIGASLDDPINLPPNGTGKKKEKVKKSKKNSINAKQSLSVAIKAGAKTDLTIALEGQISELENRIKIKDDQIKIRVEKERLDSLFDRLGQIPPKELLTEEGFRMVKIHFPDLTKKDFFNKFAPLLYKRRKAVMDLGGIAQGTVLDRDSQASLLEVGIGDPSKFMSVSKGGANVANKTREDSSLLRRIGGGVAKVAGTVLQSASQAALDTGRAGIGGEHNPFAAAGQASLRKEALEFKERDTRIREEGVGLKRQESSLKFGELGLKREELNLKKINKDLDLADTQIRREDIIRKEYNPKITKFNLIRSADDKLTKSLKLETAIGDLAAIFAFMKILDPGSTVREGEVATVENSRGTTDSLRNFFNKTLDGVKLSNKQRKEFSVAAKGLYQSEETRFLDEANRIRDIAKNRNLDLDNIFGLAGVPSLSRANQSRDTKRLMFFGKPVNFNGTASQRRELTQQFRELKNELTRRLKSGEIPASQEGNAEKKAFNFLLNISQGFLTSGE